MPLPLRKKMPRMYIRDWTDKLTIALRRVGLRVTAADHSLTRNGFQFSIENPASFHEVVAIFVAHYNEKCGGGLTMRERRPYIFLLPRDEKLLYEIDNADAILLEKEKARLIAAKEREALEARRSAFWADAVATSGFEGEFADVKRLLKRAGLRCPY